MGSSSKACLLIITIQLISTISAQETDKRVPQGFLGVRGKKYMPEEIDPVLAHLMYSDQGEKLDEEYSKRAPMGFMGMRGKKGDEVELIPKRDGSLIGQIDYSRNDIAKDSDFPLLDELLSVYLRKITGQSQSNEVEKRAANMNQFYGVRGKKSYDKRPFDLNFRGKFIGVRGKKDARNNGVKDIKFLLNPNEPWPKRKGQMGFFGMRGKKWVYESNSESEQSN